MEQMEGIASAGAGGDAHPSASSSVAADAGGEQRKIRAPKDLKASDLRAAGLLEVSDLEAWSQLIFHGLVLAACGAAVGWAYSGGRWGLMLLAEVPNGVAMSFLFNAFHEMMHCTVFTARWLNTVWAHVLGFLNFRSALWFWCFHWSHHRYTNDPAKDPELSGGSLDLNDPTRSLRTYAAYVTGWPFGFERLPRLARRALHGSKDPWILDKSASMQRSIQVEAIVYCSLYALVALAALLRPVSVGAKLVVFWLLPHTLGAGHLRMYQFAEHRACQSGPYTDTSAWACARTTSTWWFYRKLAWQMPYHAEHHAFPNVPFHKLKATHELVKRAYQKEGYDPAPTGCSPDGRRGYIGTHLEFFQRVLRNEGAGAARALKASGKSS